MIPTIFLSFYICLENKSSFTLFNCFILLDFISQFKKIFYFLLNWKIVIWRCLQVILSITDLIFTFQKIYIYNIYFYYSLLILKSICVSNLLLFLFAHLSKKLIVFLHMYHFIFYFPYSLILLTSLRLISQNMLHSPLNY